MNATRKSLVADLSLLLLLCHETLTCDQNVRVIKNRGTALNSNGLDSRFESNDRHILKREFKFILICEAYS